MSETHSLTMRFTVEEKDTVASFAPGMPEVAATPYLVQIAELACFELARRLIEPGQITVGARVVIDHLAPSKVGSELVVDAVLQSREKNRFAFNVEIKDGARVVATVQHYRAAVSEERIRAALL